jgi:hypothetical protein
MSSGKSDLSAMPDQEFDREMAAFGQQHPSNPAVVWLGYSPAERRKTVRWELVCQIDVKRVFSRGLNPAWGPALNSADGNFFRFVTACQDTYRDEYRADRTPPDRLSLIIGIVHPDNPDAVELIDGAHRLASLILNHADSVGGYIGRY